MLVEKDMLPENPALPCDRETLPIPGSVETPPKVPGPEPVAGGEQRKGGGEEGAATGPGSEDINSADLDSARCLIHKTGVVPESTRALIRRGHGRLSAAMYSGSRFVEE